MQGQVPRALAARRRRTAGGPRPARQDVSYHEARPRGLVVMMHDMVQGGGVLLSAGDGHVVDRHSPRTTPSRAGLQHDHHPTHVTHASPRLARRCLNHHLAAGQTDTELLRPAQTSLYSATDRAARATAAPLAAILRARPIRGRK